MNPLVGALEGEHEGQMPTFAGASPATNKADTPGESPTSEAKRKRKRNKKKKAEGVGMELEIDRTDKEVARAKRIALNRMNGIWNVLKMRVCCVGQS